jgi:uncharacterized protein
MGLGGTAWHLAELHTVDGGDPVIPDDPAAYTAWFRTDGGLAVNADCNAGSGTWSSPGGSGLEVGPLALTRALCPPGSLDAAFVAALTGAASHEVAPDRLTIAGADGGATLVFVPGPSFDCAAAEGSAQERICADASLAALDRILGRLYARALERFPEEETATLKAFQRGWIRGRDDCWKANDLDACVRDAYETRITELEIATGAVVVPEIVGYLCDGNVVISVVTYDTTTRPAAVLTRVPDDQVIAYRVEGPEGVRFEGGNVSFAIESDGAQANWNGEELRCVAR